MTGSVDYPSGPRASKRPSSIKRALVCAHFQVTCINQYELIRKYRCSDCGTVMMCACDQDFARNFLPHQTQEGTEFKSQRRVAVTAGFQPKICSECRGLPADAAPHAEGYGNTSKIKRYYWRELCFDARRRQATWEAENPNASEEERRAAYPGFQAEALETVKILHATKPKYSFAEPSQSEILALYKVPVIDLKAPYAPTPTRGAVIQQGGSIISPERFAQDWLESQGWNVMQLESQPLHVLFGVFFWRLIQDYEDPLARMVGFAEKTEESVHGGPGQVWALHPSDFGSEGYAERRRRAVDRHFREIAREDDLLWLFDYWLPYSHELRQYLWAHRQRHVDCARKLVEILPRTAIDCILRYLLDAYWDRYLGWPDLFMYRDQEFEFAEVKSSSDRLNGNQKAWIRNNHDILHFKFRIIKIHRSSGRAGPAFTPKRCQ
jgi:hypothetical protein